MDIPQEKVSLEICRDQKIGILTVGDLVRDLKHHPLVDSTPRGYLNQGNVRECYCDCGKVILLSEAVLRRGKNKSCGCWKQKKSQEAYEARLRYSDLQAQISTYTTQIRNIDSRLEIMRFHPLTGQADKAGMLALAKEMQTLKSLRAGAKRSFASLKRPSRKYIPKKKKEAWDDYPGES